MRPDGCAYTPGAMQSAPFAHSSAPHTVAPRRKYREPQPPAAEDAIPLGTNMMFDKRVVRGNTYAAQILPATANFEQLDGARKAQRQTKRLKAPANPDTPDAVAGRKHMDVQTEQYLEVRNWGGKGKVGRSATGG